MKQIREEGSWKISMRRMDLTSGKNSKVIFLSRTGFGEETIFRPSEGSLKTLHISAFSQDQIADYIRNYIQVKERKGSQVDWTYDEFITAIEMMQKVGLDQVISNPFLLKIMMESLPIIVEDAKKEKSCIRT